MSSDTSEDLTFLLCHLLHLMQHTQDLESSSDYELLFLLGEALFPNEFAPTSQLWLVWLSLVLTPVPTISRQRMVPFRAGMLTGVSITHGHGLGSCAQHGFAAKIWMTLGVPTTS